MREKIRPQYIRCAVRPRVSHCTIQENKAWLTTGSMADVLYTGQYKLDLERRLMMTTSLEWTRYHNGFYMDYFFSSRMPTHLTPGKYVIDLDNKKVIVPGDGDSQITFTHTTDVAKFVVASLSLPVWPARQYIVGDQLSWNDFVDKAERISGMPFAIITAKLISDVSNRREISERE